MPPGAHGVLEIPEHDAVGILQGQHATRLPGLVPVRVGRMLQSPFSFYRGAAAVMAHDLARSPVTGHTLVANGDAHLANFGLFASPERRLIFDLNDFDEAYPAPWEWDMKRLAASIWVNGRQNSHREEECRTAVHASVRSYRGALRQLYRQHAMERFYVHMNMEKLVETKAVDPCRFRTDVQKARQRTSEQVLAKLASTVVDGELRIVDQPPIVRHPEVKDLAMVEHLVARYRSALRIVGVGSVGTRSWVLMLESPAGEPLFLQAKEAGRSVLETHGSLPHPPDPVVNALTTHGQGYRVVGAQRILQAQSDPFLGWIRDVEGDDGVRRDFYIRQFRDMKGSFTLADMTGREAANYGRLCGWLLARAHSQSPGSAFVLGYLGRSEVFDSALAAWARSYADQTEADHTQLQRAVRSGRLAAETGV